MNDWAVGAAANAVPAMADGNTGAEVGGTPATADPAAPRLQTSHTHLITPGMHTPHPSWALNGVHLTIQE